MKVKQLKSNIIFCIVYSYWFKRSEKPRGVLTDVLAL